MISLTCFVVHPCLLDESWLFILYAISCGISGGLPLFDLFFNPSMPSSLYLFNQSEAHVLLLCRSLATCAGICLSYVTFKTSNILSFTCASDSSLYSCSKNLVLERLLLSIKWIECICYLS